MHKFSISATEDTAITALANLMMRFKIRSVENRKNKALFDQIKMY